MGGFGVPLAPPQKGLIMLKSTEVNRMFLRLGSGFCLCQEFVWGGYPFWKAGLDPRTEPGRGGRGGPCQFGGADSTFSLPSTRSLGNWTSFARCCFLGILFGAVDVSSSNGFFLGMGCSGPFWRSVPSFLEPFACWAYQTYIPHGIQYIGILM